MSDAFITSAVRTPVGRAGGALTEVRPDDLAAVAVKGARRALRRPRRRIDDVIFGCTNQAGEDNRNVARMAVLLAGLPVDVPGPDREPALRLRPPGRDRERRPGHPAGEGDVFIAGGVESMTRAPYVMLKSGSAWNRTPPPMADTTVGWRFVNPRMTAEWTISLGETAEKVARQYGITRAEQDAFARREPAPGPGRHRGRDLPRRNRAGAGSRQGRPDETMSTDEHPRGGRDPREPGRR